jgi:hypothetical protein
LFGKTSLSADKMADKDNQDNEDAEDAAQAERIRWLRLENTRLRGIKAASDIVLAEVRAEEEQMRINLQNLQGPPPPPPL